NEVELELEEKPANSSDKGRGVAVRPTSIPSLEFCFLCLCLDFEPNQDEELDEIDLAGMLIAAKHIKSSRRPRNNNRRPSR
ncbi:hypothetical protein PoMZ_11215, partial [Pyricularia oryzae]